MKWFVCFVLAGCSFSMDLTKSYVAPDLLQGTVPQYVKEFHDRCEAKAQVPFVALVSRLPQGAKSAAVAHCAGVPGGAVYILLEKWLAMNDNQRRATVFHELAHCALGMAHNPQNWLMAGDGVIEAEVQGMALEDFYKALGCD
jgi:hypothetical protein